VEQPKEKQTGGVNNMREANLKINSIGSNMTELSAYDFRILFSYSTPVAGFGPSGAFHTDEYFSKTTSRHINKYFTNNNLTRAESQEVPQEYIEGLLRRDAVYRKLYGEDVFVKTLSVDNSQEVK